MKSAARLAREIEIDIVGRGWPVGQLLGSEAALMTRYGVGRGAVRQAVRILEDRQLVRPRQGRSGGLVVTAPDLEGVAAAARVFLWHGQVCAEHLHALWGELFTSVVGDLADALDPAGAALLAQTWERAPVDAECWSPLELHTRLLQLADNPPAAVVLQTVLEAWRPVVAGQEQIRVADDCHAGLLAALLRGDASAAQAAARAFFTAFPATELGVLHLSGGPAREAQKLGRRAAEDLLTEIRARGWPVPGLLGTERQVQERLGVSRAPLREAIRLLESWSVVEARRGNGGGLMIVAPDPSAVRNAARAWLDHAGATRAAVFAVRMPLEALAVRTLMTAVTPAAVARLRAVLAAEREVGAGYVRLGPDARRPSLSTEIARLSGNPALALFVPVLLDLVRARGLRVDRPEAGARWVAEHHAGLVAAIEQGDAAHAELLMRRYVRAVEQVEPVDRALAHTPV